MDRKSVIRSLTAITLLVLVVVQTMKLDQVPIPVFQSVEIQFMIQLLLQQKFVIQDYLLIVLQGVLAVMPGILLMEPEDAI